MLEVITPFITKHHFMQKTLLVILLYSLFTIEKKEKFVQSYLTLLYHSFLTLHIGFSFSNCSTASTQNTNNKRKFLEIQKLGAANHVGEALSCIK